MLDGSYLKLATLTLLALSSILSTRSEACTAFSVREGGIAMSCKRFDYFDNAGLVVTNPVGIHRQAIAHADFKGRPATWTSKYGSLIFTGFGAGFPGGGINLRGLTVESLRNSNSVFPPEQDNGLPYINNRQWVQFLLDQAPDVKTAVKIAQKIRVQDVYAQTHLYLSDPSGDAAILEYIDGKLEITTGEDLKTRVITNDPWHISGPKLDQPISADPQVDSRFERVAEILKGPIPNQHYAEWAFNTLAAVPLGERFLSWRIVYDVSNLKDIKIYFNSTQNSAVKVFKLNSFSFDRSAKSQMVDIQDPTLGREGFLTDITKKFVDYDFEKDKAIVAESSVVQIGEHKFPGVENLMLSEIHSTNVLRSLRIGACEGNF